MSLIMGILDKDFCILCSDSRLNKFDGTKDFIQKVSNFRKDLIYAIGGDAAIMMNMVNEISMTLDMNIISFYDLYIALGEKFQKYAADPTTPNISICIGGYMNEKFMKADFLILNSEFSTNFYDGTNIPQRRLYGNTELHIGSIKKYFSKKEMTVEEILEGFQNVLNDGALIDNAIDTNCQYAYIANAKNDISN